MSADKQSLRRELRRNPAQPDSGAICENILTSQWFQQARTVLAYAAIPPEPDLSSVLREILSSGKILLLPRCDDKEHMSARVVRDLNELVPGAFSIPEPAADSEIADPISIDLVLVPGMAFDRFGGRLGKGKGYYDRFLMGLPAKTMGVSGVLLPKIPMENHDLHMNAVVTAEKVYYIGNGGRRYE